MSLREVFLEGLGELSSSIHLPAETWRAYAASMATPNTVVELTGTYGVAKTTLALGTMKVFFGDVYSQPVRPIVRLRETLTEFDVFWYLSVRAMMSDDEEREVRPRPIVTSPFKFFNEARRGSPRVYQLMLSLLSEGELEYRGRTYRSEPFFCVLDSNPRDAASHEMPKALADRVDARIPVGVPDPLTAAGVVSERAGRWRSPVDGLETVMESADMKRVWAETSAVEFPEQCALLLSFVHAALQCARRYTVPLWAAGEEVEVDRTLTEGGFQLLCDQCGFKGSLCSRVAEVWGIRWMISAARLAVGMAWLDGRGRASLRDVAAALPYVLNHRLVLRDGAAYPNTFTFLRLYIPAMLRVSGQNWAEAAVLAARALSGDEEALDGLASVASRDPAVTLLASAVRRRLGG
jgi:MoxR-like ATPase